MSTGKCLQCKTYHGQIHNGAEWRHRLLQPQNLLMLGIGVGLILLYQKGMTHITSIPWETLALITYLGLMLSFTRVWQYFPSTLPLWGYIPLAGVASAFMDSFLVLVIVALLPLKANDEKQVLIFKTYTMLSALIGGLLTYFGEVYAIPIALMYDQREWYSMLPMAPVVVLYVGLLTVKAASLTVEQSPRTAEAEIAHPFEPPRDRRWKYLKIAEFIAFVVLLLAFKDPILLLGVLVVYYALQGFGMSAFNLWRWESEVDVILLLVFIGIAAMLLPPQWLSELPLLAVFGLSVINAVAMAAVFPATGDFYFDIYLISVAVLVTPVSSLVGIIVFKDKRSWLFYIRTAFPWVILWAVLMGGWWMVLSQSPVGDWFHEVSGIPKPVFIVSQSHHH